MFRLDQHASLFNIYQFKTENLETDSFLKQKNFVLKSLKAYFNKEHDQLMAKFKRLDSEQRGWIKITDWACVISDHMKNSDAYSLDAKNLIDLRHYLLPCNTLLGVVYYEDM